jgi:hypothetical protein
MDATTNTTEDFLKKVETLKSEVETLKSEVYTLNCNLKHARTQLEQYKFPVEKITQDDIRGKVARVRDCTDSLLTHLSDDCGYLIANNYEYNSESPRVMDETLNLLAERIGDLYRVLKGYQFLNEYKVSGTMDFTAIIAAKSKKEAEEYAKEDIYATGLDYAHDTEVDSIDIDDVKYQCKAKD